jgi:hypothetical protein
VAGPGGRRMADAWDRVFTAAGGAVWESSHADAEGGSDLDWHGQCYTKAR